jgi:orotate phosphoribosyltransferase-like protein
LSISEGFRLGYDKKEKKKSNLVIRTPNPQSDILLDWTQLGSDAEELKTVVKKISEINIKGRLATLNLPGLHSTKGACSESPVSEELGIGVAMVRTHKRSLWIRLCPFLVF